MATDTPKAETAAPQLPMFYKSLALLNKAAHGDLRLRPAKSMSFAAKANSIVLAGSEFAAASHDYPIVFSGKGAEPTAFAVTGRKTGENMFVSKDGAWKKGAYVPAYVRRYPFMLVKSPDGTNYNMAIDPESEMIHAKIGDPLFDGDKPSKATERMLELSKSFIMDMERTATIIRQLDTLDLLEERQIEVTLANGTKSRIGGFRVVNETKLTALSDGDFLALRKTGALPVVYMHLVSQQRWAAFRG